MPRSPAPIEDRTSLHGARIDVAARIGWLLRTSRSVAGLPLRQMSAALKDHDVALSATTLSRIESEGHRSPAALDGYAAVLGLPEGALRAPVDMMCRTFPYAPAAPPRPTTPNLDDFSRCFEAVDVDVPTGGAWLELARQHAEDSGFGLPRTLMEPHVRRMALELARSVGAARFTRIEALTQLRCSAYADVVDGVTRELVLEPDSQNFWDLMSVGAGRPTPSYVDWTASLLRHPSIYVARGASYALQSMLVAGGLGLGAWTALGPHLDVAWRDAADEPARREVLAQLWTALPPPVKAQVPATCRPEPTTPGRTPRSREPNGARYAYAASLARMVATSQGQPEEPLLGRLLYEAMFESRGVRMASATVLLACSPFSAALVSVLVGERDSCPDAASRAAAMRVAAFCHDGEDHTGVESLLESPDATEFQHGLTIVSRGDRLLAQAAVDRGLAADEVTARRTLYALGMTGDPRLSTIATRRSLPSSVRRGARWWTEQGPRIRS